MTQGVPVNTVSAFDRLSRGARLSPSLPQCVVLEGLEAGSSADASEQTARNRAEMRKHEKDSCFFYYCYRLLDEWIGVTWYLDITCRLNNNLKNCALTVFFVKRRYVYKWNWRFEKIESTPRFRTTFCFVKRLTKNNDETMICLIIIFYKHIHAN